MTSPKWGPDPIAVWIRDRLEAQGKTKTWLQTQLVERYKMSAQNAHANVTRWTIRGTVPDAENVAMLEAILDATAPLIEAEAYRDHEARIVVLERDQETLMRLAIAAGTDRRKWIAALQEALGRRTGGS